MDMNSFCSIKSIEAEIEVLGAILVKPKLIETCVMSLKIEDFYLEKHKKLYKGILNLYYEGKDISVTTLIEEITREKLKEVGGISYISELITSGLPVNIEGHIEILKEKSYRRKIMMALNKGLKYIQNEKIKAFEIAGKIQNDLLEDEEFSKRKILSDEDLFSKTLDKIEKIYNSKGNMFGMKTGFYKFDSVTNGLQKGELVVIGGRPSMGKTATALSIAEGLADNGSNVLLFEMEMTEESLGIRRFAARSNIKASKISSAKLNDVEFTKLINTFNEFSKRGRIFTDCSSYQDILKIKSKCNGLKISKGLDVVIIDHLGLMDMSKGENRVQAVGEVTRSLKLLAKELDICIILLCQLSRAVEQRRDKIPMLSDLRESGNIEQDADLVMFIYREDYYDNECENKDVICWVIAKQRNGKTGTLEFKYLDEFQRIENL